MKKKRMNNKAMSLAELIVVLALLTILILSIYSVYLIFFTSITYDVERYTISSQVSYALSDIKSRCLSASIIKDDSRFIWSGESKTELNFTGEKDIYNISPDDSSDNIDYSYYVRSNGDFVLEDETGKTDVLVEGKYQPAVEFTYSEGHEPNFMTVSVTAVGTKTLGSEPARIKQEEGVRFWFVDIVR